MEITELLSEYVVDTPFSNFGGSEIEKAKSRISDVIGCAIGGANAPGCQMIIDMVHEWGGKKQGSVIGHGLRLPAHNAAMVNSIMARSYDFEPAGPMVDGKSTPAHVSGTTVPTAVAIGEQKEVSGNELIAALIIGDDVAARIIAASNLDLDSGFESTGIANMFGATAIAGRIIGLSITQMRNAFGIALNQASGTFQNIFDASHSFKLPQGLAARGAIFSANLAAKGFTSVKDFLNGKYGYFSLYCKTCDPNIIIKDLGKRFYADNSIKPYPCCRSNHSAIECILDLMHEYSIQHNNIDTIEVNVPKKAKEFITGQPFIAGQVPQINAAFSLQYTVASTLLKGSMSLENFTEKVINKPEIVDIISKIILKGDLPPDKPLAASVKVRMKNGLEYMKKLTMPKGNETFTPLSKDEKRQKFFDNVNFSKIISTEKATEAFAMFEQLEEIKNIKKVVKLLT